jgi:hypothetical protein
MSRSTIHHRKSRPRALNNRTLRLEPLEPRLTLSANFLGLSDPALASYVRSLFRDGSINRTDMISILNRVQTESDGVVTAANLSDLRIIVGRATYLKMPGHVSTLAGDIVNGSVANAHYQGVTLGNLVAGDSNAKLQTLTNKWFYGTDVPEAETYTYSATSGTIWGATGPLYTDQKQGALGDCYLISALGSLAYSSKAAIKNMFIVNGDGTWTVRFYYNGKADYVTVNNLLPVSGSTLVYDGYGSSVSDTSNRLWLPLAEKAYAQWNETGRTARGTATNSYAAIDGGWTGDVYRQTMNKVSVYSMSMLASAAQTTLQYSLKSHRAITVGTPSALDPATGLVGGHAYTVLSYNTSTRLYTLYNPWGHSQPNALTWAQLRANTDGLSATAPNAALNAITMYMDRGRSSRTVAMTFDTSLTTTITTFDAPSIKSHADVPLAPVAVDAALANWDAVSGNTWQQTKTPSRSNSSLSDVRTATNDAFTDIDTLFDSIRIHATLAV